MTKFSFILPLRSRETTDNWDRISYDCINTINSILQQTNNDFDVYLVCNQKPDNLTCHNSQLNIIIDDFPIPRSYSEMHQDQIRKIKKALVKIGSEDQEKFIMRVDADDFVSKHIVNFVKQHPHTNGFYFPWGYFFQQKLNYIMLQPNFYLYCGTSAIVKFTKEDFPKSEDVLDNSWLKTFWQHQGIVSHMKNTGREMEKLPFPGAVRQCGTGENISKADIKTKPQRSLKKIAQNFILRRKLSKKLIEEFGIPEEMVN